MTGSRITVIAMMWIIIGLLSVFSPRASAQESNSGEERVLLMPLFGYSDEQGLGVGANAAWLNILGSPWSATAVLFASSVYQQTYLDLAITNQHLLDILYFQAGGWLNRSTRALFYGIGNDSSLANENQYSITDAYFWSRGGIHIFEELVAGLTYTHRSTGIDLGSDPNLPQFLDTYWYVPRKSGTTTTSVGVFAQYDTRAPALAPNSGDYVLLLMDQAQPRPGEDMSQSRVLVIDENFWNPIDDKDFALVTRGRYERQWGEDVPFFLETNLGGVSTLRGFRTNRFIDAGQMLINVEPRYNIWNTGGQIIQRVEVSLGLDVGRVFDGVSWPPIWGYHTNWDIGLTPVISGGIPLRMDYAFGPEGSLFYLHLFYPF